MAFLTRGKFAARCGVSEMAISKAITRGDVVERDGKIDPSNPTNQAYHRADHAEMKRTSPKDQGTAQRVGGKGISAERRAQLWEQKQVEAIKALQSRTARDDTARAKMLNILIERRVAEGAIALLVGAVQTQIFDRIHAMVPTIKDKIEKGAPIEEVYQYADQEAAEAAQALIRVAQSVTLEN